MANVGLVNDAQGGGVKELEGHVASHVFRDANLVGLLLSGV